MPDRRLVIAIGAVVALPLVFAALGASSGAGILVGIVLVLVGAGWMLGAGTKDG